MTNMNSELPSAHGFVKRNWGWLLALGVVFELAGFISLGMVVSVTLASMFLIGALVLVTGVFQLIDVFRSQGWKAAAWHFLIALLYIFAGSLIIYDPFIASTIITAMLAWTLIIIGVARAFMAFSIRQSKGWFWLLLAGIASIALGVMILMQWPASGLWVIGLFISIELIINGWSYVLLALAIRQS